MFDSFSNHQGPEPRPQTGSEPDYGTKTKLTSYTDTINGKWINLMNDYQTKALETLAGARTYEDFIDRTEFERDTFGFVVAASRLENYKKTLAYGKNLPKFQSINPVNVRNTNVLHAKLGIAGESAEVFDAQTKEEVKLECGDLLWYMAVLLNEYGLTFDEVMEANIEKLNKRYKSGKFTQEEALNRT